MLALRKPESVPAEPLTPLLTANQAARLLAISPRKLWQLTNIGDVRAVRFGRSVRYDPADLRDWIERNKTGGPRR